MPTTELEIISPPLLSEFIQSENGRRAVQEIADAVGARLTVLDSGQSDTIPDNPRPPTEEFPLRVQNDTVGKVICRTEGPRIPVINVARATCGLLQHILDRETAVSALATEMLNSYEELNMHYNLLPRIIHKTEEGEVGEILVEEASRLLNCRRVSLLVLDERLQNFKVLAAVGLPEDIRDIAIPVEGSIAEYAFFQKDVLVINNVATRPDLAKISRGKYDTNSFAVVRMPLFIRGKGIGILSATERREKEEFSTRELKIMEGLSSIGAAVLLNCRLHETINRQNLSTIQALASAVDAKDHYTHDHSGRVAEFSVTTAKQLGVKDVKKWREIEMAGLLHDIGKIGISDAILSKAGKLAPEEFEIIKTHSQIGANIVGQVHGMEEVAKAILHHHERYDGLGYPFRLEGDAIPFAARLLACVDTFDSLTSNRSYRKALSLDRAIREIRENRGTQLDPSIVDTFLTVIANRG